MLRSLFFLLIISFRLTCFAQEYTTYTDEVNKKFWYDKDGRPLVKSTVLNSKDNSNNEPRGITVGSSKEGLSYQSIKSDPKSSSLNSEKEINLSVINYNERKVFKISDWQKETQKNKSIERQELKIGFKLSKEHIDILGTSPLNFSFLLDKKQKESWPKFELTFTRVKNEIIIKLQTYESHGYYDHCTYKSKIEGVDYKKYVLTINLGNQKTQFGFKLTDFGNLNQDTCICQEQIKDDPLYDKFLAIEKTSIVSIDISFEGIKKNLDPIRNFYIFDKSEYRDNYNRAKSKRKAIIIANNYENNKYVKKLDEFPLKDARDVIKKLKSGVNNKLWEIDSSFNLMKNDLQMKFKDKSFLDGYDTLFIYYAGHGVSTNILADNGEKKWEDYWVPPDFSVDLNSFLREDKDSLTQDELKQVTNQLYSISDVLKSLYEGYKKIYPEEYIRDNVKIMVLSDACREDISSSKRALYKPPSTASEIGFDYMVYPVVAEGKFADNLNSWTQKYFINYHDTKFYYTNPFSNLPRQGASVVPYQNCPSNKNKPAITDPFMGIVLLK